MQLVDLTLPSPAENLALDEALLEEAEAVDSPREFLRWWEPAQPSVIVGRGSRLAEEVNIDYCRQAEIDVLRRTSGGAAIVTGRGCLMYAVVLSYKLRPTLRAIDVAHDFVLDTNRRALATILNGVERRGTSDLAIGDMKFSGNSLRCKRRAMLYHGTLLFDFDLPLISKALVMPPRQPDYRAQRPHAEFVTNLPATAADLKRALTSAWQASPNKPGWPEQRVRELVATRYSQSDWNYQR